MFLPFHRFAGSFNHHQILSLQLTLGSVRTFQVVQSSVAVRWMIQGLTPRLSGLSGSSASYEPSYVFSIAIKSHFSVLTLYSAKTLPQSC